jgi:hypothetical protein
MSGTRPSRCPTRRWLRDLSATPSLNGSLPLFFLGHRLEDWTLGMTTRDFLFLMVVFPLAIILGIVAFVGLREL